jgi:hypothetical protein
LLLHFVQQRVADSRALSLKPGLMLQHGFSPSVGAGYPLAAIFQRSLLPSIGGSARPIDPI